MKVLFAVNNDSISETVMKKYQRDYKEILSYKNVYYFNAILKELQNNKDYDRIVISEDLEPFANNNYDTIDKFLFEKLERINEETKSTNGTNIEVILICADRRSKSDDMLIKLFGIGMYNALIGDDRNIDILCKLMKQPRTKKEAKVAYKVEGNTGMYQTDDENGVSESEVQNILAHYKRLGKNEDKYVDSFNNIVSQYTDAQLKIIIKCLPLHVKAVLEQKSPKYQQLSTFSVRNNRKEEPYTPRNLKTINEEEKKIDVKMLQNDKKKITKPIVIPSELNNQKTVKIQQKIVNEDDTELDSFEEEVQETPKKGRGRPRKNPIQEIEEDKPKRGRGRPKKEVVQEDKEDEFDIDLFNIDSDEDEKDTTDNLAEDMDFDLFNMNQEDNVQEDEENSDDVDLFDMEESDSDDEDVDLFNMNDDNEEEDSDGEDKYIIEDEEPSIPMEENHYIEPTIKNTTPLSTLLTSEKKIVSFVGTTKNGTSFIVNNLGLTLSDIGISTAILDMTQNKNSYYIYTKNEEKLRKIAENSISNLEKGIAEGIKVAKNLTVYTEVPGEDRKHENIENILVTLMENHDVVLIDTDFNTNIDCFKMSQEIYLVQSMDVLTIQPLTAFLRNLKAKNVLEQEKVKIIINKEQRLRTLTDSILIGGMSSYNDPTMTLMTDLFNKDNVKYCKIPFEVQNYVKYLDSLVNCEIYLRGYTKALLIALNELAEMVYPLLNKTKYKPNKKNKNRMEFSNETRNTLNKMRKNY
ncbi:MAG: hypothetical protein J6A29_01890 [Clostridia bacterium]|nr:hypothetical protein [Clostridia bacterium]